MNNIIVVAIIIKTIRTIIIVIVITTNTRTTKPLPSFHFMRSRYMQSPRACTSRKTDSKRPALKNFETILFA